MRMVVIAGLGLLLGSCSKDAPIDDGTGTTDGGGGDDGGSDGDGVIDCEEDGECSAWEICELSECVDGDRNNSVDEAEGLLWDDAAAGYINPADDVDYFTFTAEGGEYIRIDVQHESEEGDTVIVLRNPAGKVHSFVDNHPTGGSVSTYDSVMYTYLDEAGTWSVSVEDVGSYYGGDIVSHGGSDFRYEVRLTEWSRHTDEADSAEDPSVSVEIDGTNTWYSVGALMEEAGDSDWIQLVLNVDNVQLLAGGVVDLDGSSLSPLGRLYDADGNVLSQKAEVGPDGSMLYPFLSRGTYLFELTDADGAGAADAWTYAFFIASDANTAYDDEFESNDELAWANNVELTETESSSGNLYSYGNQFGSIDVAEDVDWFVVEQPYDDAWLILCLTSSPDGSLVAPDIAIYDASGVLLAEEAGNELTDPTATIDELTVGPGTYYFAVSGGADSLGLPGEWYRFTTYAATFQPTSYSCP